MSERAFPDHHSSRRGGRWVTCLLIGAALLLAGCNSEQIPPDSVNDDRGNSAGGVAGADSNGAQSTGEGSADSGAPVEQATSEVPDPLDCTAADCHQDMLRVTYRHAPFQNGKCEACHEAEQPEHKFPQKRSAIETCTFCHLVIGEKEFLHDAVRSGGCAACHDPHGSNTKFLLSAASTELTCRECHDIERKAYLHGPFAAGECTTCHQPHESDNRLLLLGGEGRAHCLLCHQTMVEQLRGAKVIHEPLDEGCTECHEAHSSEHAALLTDWVDRLCFGCHAEIEDRVAEAAIGHEAVVSGRGCANCHDPHAGERAGLLPAELRTLCLSCHSEPQRARDGRTIPDMRAELSGRKSLHGPVASGQCDACHEPHGSPNAQLLHWPYPTEFYTAFDLEKYALCFECHNSAAVLNERTTTDTNFRDGDRNLHFLHVNRAEKGRTCRTCHEVHGSDLPRHMAEAVPFEKGGWNMPIGFEQTENGGRCSPGCHEPQEYRH